MDIKKIIKVAQKAGKYFLQAAGLVGVICMIVGVFFVVPPLIGLPVALGMGLIWSVVGAKKRLEEDDEENNETQQRMQVIGNIAERKDSLHSLKDAVLDDLEEVELKQDITSFRRSSVAPFVDGDQTVVMSPKHDDSPPAVLLRLTQKQNKHVRQTFMLFSRNKPRPSREQPIHRQSLKNIP